MTEHNLPDKDDAPWLNLSEKEIEELRNKKQELLVVKQLSQLLFDTEYGKEKIRKLLNKEKLNDD